MNWNSSSDILEQLNSFGAQTAWHSLYENFRPRIQAYARKRGIPAELVGDVVQESLMSFAQAYRNGKYDREKGPLRSWLFGFVHNTISKALKQHCRQLSGREEASLTAVLRDQVEAVGELEELWEAEWKRVTVQECLQIVQGEVAPATFEIFKELAIKERAAADVAQAMNIPLTKVYNAKYRVSTRLAELIKERSDF